MVISVRTFTVRSNTPPLPDCGREAETDRERDGDDRRIGCEEHGVGEARRDFRQHIAAVGERMAEIAAQRAEQPFDIAEDRRLIETEIQAQLGEVLRSRLILQDGGCEIARQESPSR